jgi:tRNA (guanosine-2'-O-)-methyltransferase
MTPITYKGEVYSPESIINQLKPQVSPERWQNIQRVVANRNKHIVSVLENIYDQGNSSAVMRSAEAFGFYQIHHIVETKEFKDIRGISMGAEKWLVQEQWDSGLDCVSALKKNGYQIYVTQLDQGRSIYEVPFDRPVAFCFGNERDGISQKLIQQADEKVFIPMQGFVQSFNISVAAALCLQVAHTKIKEQQAEKEMLSAEEQTYLQALYLLRSCKNPGL